MQFCCERRAVFGRTVSTSGQYFSASLHGKVITFLREIKDCCTHRHPHEGVKEYSYALTRCAVGVPFCVVAGAIPLQKRTR